MEKEMTREQIAFVAMDLFAGGWRAADRDEFKKEYNLADWETDVMQEELEKLESLGGRKTAEKEN